MVRETKFFLNQRLLSLSPPSFLLFPFSLVAFTLLLVNICFHASTCHEVDPRCAEESSMLTCPYVSDVIPSKENFLLFTDSNAVLHRSEGFRLNPIRSIKRLRFYGEATRTDHKVCFKSIEEALCQYLRIENVESFLLYDMENNATIILRFCDTIPYAYFPFN